MMVCTVKAYFIKKVSGGLLLLPQSLFNTRIESIENSQASQSSFSVLLMFLAPEKQN